MGPLLNRIRACSARRRSTLDLDARPRAFAAKVALLLATLTTGAIAPLPASAAPQTYRGTLERQNIGQTEPIPVTLVVDLIGSRMVGKVTTSKPLPGGGYIDGERTTHECRLWTELGNGTTMSLRGYCDEKTFEGAYRINFRAGNNWQGRFKLTNATPSPRSTIKTPDAAREPTLDSGASSKGWASATRTDCLRRKTSCLVGCPTGDPTSEALCADRCKRRFDACAAKAP